MGRDGAALRDASDLRSLELDRAVLTAAIAEKPGVRLMVRNAGGAGLEGRLVRAVKHNRLITGQSAARRAGRIK